ncbi:MAG: beta-lactamase family protein [bacterium]|nr:beta-lactamase family protein [bacterium]
MNKIKFTVSSLIILILLLLSFPAAAQFEEVSEKITRVMKEINVPSISVAVARDGSIIWEEAFGWADKEKEIPADENTLYSLASISKPITATGLMILVEQNMIDLDMPVNYYLGDVKVNARVGDADQATVRRVLSHTAGLPLHYHFFYIDESYEKPPMDETIRRYGNLVTAPGERYQYSNLGFGILDYVISRVSKKSYIDFMKEKVFEPLGMTRTSVDIGPGFEDLHATRYTNDGTPIPFYDFDHPGASAIYSSAHDLVKFGMFHLKNHLDDQDAIIKDGSIDEMHMPVAPSEGYGLGWGASTRNGIKRVGHSGGMGGVSTTLILVPEDNIAVTVLSNASSWLPSVIAEDILEVLLPDRFERSDPPGRSGRDRFVPGEELIGNWTGIVDTYEGEITLTLKFLDSGNVEVYLGESSPGRLRNVSFRDGFLRGYFHGDLRTEDVNKLPYNLNAELKLRGDLLNGSVTAVSRPGKRTGNGLTHWAELIKER